jgi:DNA-directed RNA polymerase subunit RPC12/RpoP
MHIPEQEAPEKTSEFVTAVSQVANYDGQLYLNIDLFYKGVLKARYFADRMTHACHVDGSWRTCKIYNIARICMGKTVLKGNETYFHHDEWKWNSTKDNNIAYEYLGKKLETYEDDIGRTKYLNAIERKGKRIDEMMNRVPALPKDLETWLEQKVFTENYLFMQRKKNRTDYVCTSCGHKSWKKIGWKRNENTTCPHCGAPVIASLRNGMIQRREPVVVLQTMGENEWVERQLRAVCTWDFGKKEIEILEDIRAIIPKNHTWGNVWYGTYREQDEFCQEFWDTNRENKRFYESYLYPENLQEVLPYGNLQHSGLDILANKCKKINVNYFITTYHGRSWMEYWIKAGLYRLAMEVTGVYGMWGNPSYIKEDEKKLSLCLRINGDRVYRLRKLDGGLNALKWLQYEQETGKKISQESLEFLNGRAPEPSDCREILKCLGSVNRMVNYMKKQKIAPSTLLETWNDYLRMAAGEGMDVNDDIVRLPKDLKARHDELVERINGRKEEKRLKEEAEKYRKLNQKIMEHLPEVKRYFWENKDYIIIPAGKCEELVTEGRKLHHCVGASTNYMEKMAEGKSWILFLRKKEDIKKPYYTVEISMEDDRIIQWYSEYDRKPDSKKIKKVLDAFKRNVKKSERIKVAV